MVTQQRQKEIFKTRGMEFFLYFWRKRKKEAPLKHKSKHEESKSCRVSATVDFRLSHFHYQGNFFFGCAPTDSCLPKVELMKK